MPNAQIHFLLAGKVLDHWRAYPAEAPFAPDDPRAVDAFLLGSVAPDLGYFPRGDYLFSELVHLVRSGDLARSLVQVAATDAQRAYAWGWVTHVLGDAAIHPLINQACWEVVAGTRELPAVLPRDDRTHMRVEYGLDAAFFRRYPHLEQLQLRRDLDRAGAAHLTAAFGRTYGWRLDTGALLRSHRVVGQTVRAGLIFNRVATSRFRRRPLHALARLGLSVLGPPSRLLPESYGPAPLLCALLDPIPPPPWLVEEVERVVQGFLDGFGEHYTSGLRSLQNYDLTSGALAPSEPSEPRTLQALRELAERRGRPASLTPGIATRGSVR
ncbi:MAG TPA: zinc dependent phospholipase C family protein [Longimicrobiaceae bacterium]|nr:zinc dependent phospholipase C family protein [Longimicrobiaceae bacterium]